MGGKLSPLIIIILLVVLIGIGGLIFKAVFADDPKPIVDEKVEQVDAEEPIITLNKELNEDGNTSVIINVYASMENEEEIETIVLPDGTKIPGGTAQYTVEKNGTYEFKATSISGASSTASVEVTEIVEISATNPYIPDGFTVIANNIDDGFVIEDEHGNQYVWIPVPSGKLTRNTMLDADYEESSSTALALVNSVAKYYGFYIGRFEASQYDYQGEVTAASMSGKIPWTNITYLNAAEYAENSGIVFGYTNCKTALINSYAWDTVMQWIDQTHLNYSSDVNYGNYTGTIYPTGYTESDSVKNICDLSGNVREWTTEIYKAASQPNKNDKNFVSVIHRVVRGGSANLKRTPISHIYYPENTSDNYWGFRTIIYK